MSPQTKQSTQSAPARRFYISKDSFRSRKNLVFKLVIPPDEPQGVLKLLEEALKEASLSWILSTEIKDRALLLYTKKRSCCSKNDLKDLILRTVRQIEPIAEASYELYEQHNPGKTKVCASHISKKLKKDRTTKKRPAPGRRAFALTG